MGPPRDRGRDDRGRHDARAADAADAGRHILYHRGRGTGRYDPLHQDVYGHDRALVEALHRGSEPVYRLRPTACRSSCCFAVTWLSPGRRYFQFVALRAGGGPGDDRACDVLRGGGGRQVDRSFGDSRCERIAPGRGPSCGGPGERTGRAWPSARRRAAARPGASESGLSEIESMPTSARNSANSGWSLGAWPHRPTLRPCACAAVDHHRDQPLDARVALVEQVRQQLRVAVDAQRELGEIVGADREAVEELARTPSARMTLFGISHIT